MQSRQGYFARACPGFLSSVPKRLTFQLHLWAALVNQENWLLWCCFWPRRGRAILRGRWWRLMGGGVHNRGKMTVCLCEFLYQLFLIRVIHIVIASSDLCDIQVDSNSQGIIARYR